jgi:alpha-tubulin suppressor-like RCC1 family protein
MISTYTTNFIGSDGVDLGSKLLTKERFNEYYLNISNQYITPELWGWGISYTLGHNTTSYRSTPITTFAGGANWKQVSAGNAYSGAIKTDGSLWVWGLNGNGQLGLNQAPIFQALTPTTIFGGGNNWRQISFGSLHAAAIKTDGTLWTWGYNIYGQLGDNTNVQRSTPVTTFAGGNDWKQVSCGGNFTLASKTDGTLWAFGDNFEGRLGTNGGPSRSTPTQVFGGGNDWKTVSAGNNVSSAIKSDGTLWVWGGDGNQGALGINLPFGFSSRSTPITTFAGGNNWKSVSCGYSIILATKTDGSLWVWGDNDYGQLGIGSSVGTWANTPVTTFAGGNNWKQVNAGLQLSAAIKTDGTLWVWGSNPFGALGVNDSIDRCTPVTTFAGGNTWKSIECNAGGSSMLGIRSYDD